MSLLKKEEIIRGECTLVGSKPPQCHHCSLPLREHSGYALRIGPAYILLEPKPVTCPHCGEANFVAKLAPTKREGQQTLREVEADGAAPEEVGNIFEAMPRFKPRRAKYAGEKRIAQRFRIGARKSTKPRAR